MATSAASLQLRDLAHRGDSAVPELPGGHRPDPPESLDRKRVEERQLAVGGHDEQTVRLGNAAGHLGEELRPGYSDGDRQADPLEDFTA